MALESASSRGDDFDSSFELSKLPGQCRGKWGRDYTNPQHCFVRRESRPNEIFIDRSFFSVEARIAGEINPAENINASSSAQIERRSVIFMLSALRRFARDNSAATAVEYGLIASLIALVIIASVSTVGTKLKNTFTEVSGNLH
jgi:pilus assembly protein Flp/PilA